MFGSERFARVEAAGRCDTAAREQGAEVSVLLSVVAARSFLISWSLPVDSSSWKDERTRGARRAAASCSGALLRGRRELYRCTVVVRLSKLSSRGMSAQPPTRPLLNQHVSLTSVHTLLQQRSQRFTIPTSPPQHSKSRSPAPPIPSLPYQPPPPPVQSQSIPADPYYSFNRNPPIERFSSTEIPTPVSGPPYLAPGQAEEYGGGGAFNVPQPTTNQYQPYHPQPSLSQHSYAPQQASPSSYGQNYVPAPSYGGGGGGYQRGGGGRQEQSNGGRSGLPTEWMRPQQVQQQQYEQPSYQTGYAALMGRPLPEDEVYV